MGNEKTEKENVIFYDRLVEKTLKAAIIKNYSVLLVGETGVGKTSFIRDMANKTNSVLIRLNMTGQTGVDEILGKWLASPGKGMYWVDGLLITAMKKGYWIVIDEINMALPDILSALHSLLDDDKKIVLKEKDGEIVECHSEFRLFATMNPSDEYAGTKELNKSFLSRFPVVLDINYSKKESKIIQDRTGLKKEDAERLVLVAGEIRKHKGNEQLSYTCSTRDMIQCAFLMKNKFSISEAFKLSILNKAPVEDRGKISKIIELITGKTINIEDKTRGKTFKFKSVSEIKEFIEKSSKKIIEEKLKNQNMEQEIKNIRTDIMKMEDSTRMIVRDYKKEILIKDSKVKDAIKKLSSKIISKEKILDILKEI